MSRGIKWLSSLLLLSMVLAACSTATPAPEPAAEPTTAVTEVAPVATAAPAEEATAAATEEVAPAATGAAVFFSTQFEPVEEQEKFRAILQEGGFDFTGTSEGPLLDIMQAAAQAGKSEIDVVGALHGTYPPLIEPKPEVL